MQHALSLDSALWQTILGLTRNPGKLVADYVGGQRVRFVNPIKYSVGVVAVYLLVTAIFGLDPSQGVGTFRVTAPDAAQAQAVRDELVRHIDLVLYCSIPLFGLLLRAYYWRSGRNLAETYAFAFFVVGQSFLYALPLLALSAFPNLSVGLRVAIRLVLFSWAAVVFFRTPGWFGWLRGVGVMFLYVLSIIPVGVLFLLFSLARSSGSS